MRAAWLAIVVLLAGCAMPGSEESDGGSTPTPAVGRFLAPLDLGQGGPEPVVAFAPEGDRLYVAAQDPLGGGPRVWVSRDGGASFAMKRPTTEGGGEVDLAVGPGGVVYLTQLGARGNVVSVSRDRGETWTTSPLGGASQYFDREWMAVDSGGRAYLVAREFGQTASAGVARSDDKGLTFPPRGKAWTALDEPGDANGPLVAVGTTVHLIYVCRGGEAVCIATSTNGGLAWTQRVVAERRASVANVYPSLAATSSGLVATWSDASEGALAVYTAHSRDGASWSGPQKVSHEAGTNTLPWIAARGSTVWSVWLHTDAALSATDCAEAANAPWIPYARPLTSEGSASGEPVAIASTAVHTGIISPPVGVTCSGGARDRNFGDFFTAAVSPQNKLVVAISSDTGDAASTKDLVIRER